jgi:transcriptional regulator with XRE-family HTH domain
VALREWRQFRAVSQEELAKAAGIQRSTIVDIEASRRCPRPSTLRRLAKALKIKPEELYRDPFA